MAAVKRFEDLEVWKEARLLCRMIYKLMNKPAFKKDKSLCGQINRSSGSIMDNIAEGFDRGGTKEFKNFLSIAKGSCGEVRAQIYRAADRQYITKEEFDITVEKTQFISGKITNLIKYLKQTDNRGFKFN